MERFSAFTSLPRTRRTRRALLPERSIVTSVRTSPKISAVFSRTPARPFLFRAGAARLRILSYETVEADHRRTTPFVVYSGIVFLLFLPQPSFARLFVFAPASRAVRWRNGVRQI